MGAARIGRVVMKGNVAPIRTSLLQDVGLRQERGQLFQHALDDYIDQHGESPEAVVIVLCGLKQPANLYWGIEGASRGGATSVLSLAQTAIQNHLADNG